MEKLGVVVGGEEGGTVGLARLARVAMGVSQLGHYGVGVDGIEN